MFKFLLYLFKNKNPDHIMTVKSRWALVYAIMATNALLYYMYTKSEDNYPTDSESLST
ncbi:hypothetical protein WH47_05867 [Habropoda laboriosa]|uniref:Uncharacterized protein n=1 Tax=Habropoda laboriosa TaxID=597456 RepID=A0A0L7QTK8_9HYME|nr:hypothetical protein WH47_05867 [Habropoda laboriosa]